MCKDTGWITNGDRENPCACQASDEEYSMIRDLGMDEQDYEQ